ncbi:phage tail protein [Hathewaya histolytica]|uniref:phage tail protein n=1 Tax=Hathewaya histolytica TaxID=1498 RepID=UPI003B66B4F6
MGCNSWFIWNGIHSKEMNLIIESLPAPSKPEERFTEYIVPGRSGKLHQVENTFETDIKPVGIYYEGTNFDEIFNWLRGYGTITFGNQPDRYYKAHMFNKIPLECILPILHKGMISFECQPFGYLKNESNIFKIIDHKLTRNSKSINPLESLNYNGGTVYKENESIEVYEYLEDRKIVINNTGTIYSEPTITIQGNGDIKLYINAETIKLKNVEDKITMNSEMMECYKNTMPCNNKMYGEFPRFEVGENIITWEGNIKTIDIKKNTRFL